MYGYVDVDEMLRIKTMYTAFEQTYKSDYEYAGEHHNFWEIVVVMEGELGVTAGSDVFVLKKGQAVIHEPMEFHRIWSEGNSCPQIIILSFSAVCMPKLSAKVFEIADLKKTKKILDDIKNNFEMLRINAIGIKDGVGYQKAIKNLEIFILETISQKIKKDSTLNSQPAKNYTTIVNTMERNIDKNLSVGDIAKLCNMSEINLKKTFSRYSGMGVMAYFNQLKISGAITMIRSGMTIQETANALGFSNQNYFSTVFKRTTGRPPSFYKEKY